jgi:hypothetical protein
MKAFNVEYIVDEFNHRDEFHVPSIIMGVLNALAWLMLAVPLLQVVWIQCSLNHSSQVTPSPHHLLGVHMTLVVMIIGGVLSEFLSHLMYIGASETALWLSRDFNLDRWGSANAEDNTTTTDPDMIGWRSLEATYYVMRGTLLWIDAAEWIFLSITFFLLWTSVVMTPGPRTFSAQWASLGFVLGILAFVDFLFNILRVKDWRSFSMFAGVISLLNALIGMPLWLLWLGRQLYVAKANAKLPPLGATTDATPKPTDESTEGNELS